MWHRTVVASLAVCLAGGGALWHATDGLRALTSEQARRQSIAGSPRRVPDVVLEDQRGREFTLAQFRGVPVAVEFIYTRCQSLCALLSAGMRRFNEEQRASPGGALARVRLVSISFDPEGDSTPRLMEYATHYGADGEAWRLARLRDARELPGLLRAFGVVVIPDGAGGFQHNAAVHLLNADGRLARVLDVDATPADLARASATPWR
jgi:protein SCO1